MARDGIIGEFEYLVLAACERLGERAYGASIANEIEAATGRRCSSGALYLTLDRLEAKGFVATRMGGASAERGGRAKRLVRITGLGRDAGARFYSAVTRATEGIRWEEAKQCTA
ncbi:MAG: PadR family transcriptional regulator [Bryobacteraceae bacterium]